MKAAAQAVQINYKHLLKWEKVKCWSKSVPKMQIHNLKEKLGETLKHLQSPTPKTSRATIAQKWLLQSDASGQGWGATLIKSNLEKGTCAQHWTAQEAESHITHLEAKASSEAVQEMMHFIPAGAHLTIQMDASSTAWAWKKGSSKEAMHNIIAPAVKMLHQKQIYY